MGDKCDGNRSVRKTENGIKHAFLELMKEKDFHQISVKETVEAADVNRSTFYLHFKDINDLLYKIEDEVITDISDAISGIDRENYVAGQHPKHIKVFEVFKKHFDACAILLSDHGDIRFLSKLSTAMDRRIYEGWSKYCTSESEYKAVKMYAEYITFGMIGIIYNAIETQEPVDEEEMGTFAGAVTNWIDEAFVQNKHENV